MTSVTENDLDWLNLLLCRLSELELTEAGFLLLDPQAFRRFRRLRRSAIAGALAPSHQPFE
jgi:hypothetical protein